MSDTIETGTALALPAGSALASLFTRTDGLDPVLKRIEEEALARAPDLTTAKGRDAVKSLAYQIARSKTALDEAGKALNESARAQINAVDAERRKAREFLDALKDKVRAPLTAWEQQEEERIARHRRNLERLGFGSVTTAADSARVRAAIEMLEAQTTGPEWEEYQPLAVKAKADSIERLTGILAAVEEREAKDAELERLRAEAAERERRDQAEREARAAEERERQRQEEERLAAERAAQQERERQERIKQAQEEAAIRARRQAEIEAENRAHQERIEAERREAELQRQLQESKAREERAAQAERDRIAAERKAEEDARAKREADEAHRARVLAAVTGAISAFTSREMAETITAAIVAGKVPHVEVRL